jgi:hypothetical protein
MAPSRIPALDEAAVRTAAAGAHHCGISHTLRSIAVVRFANRGPCMQQWKIGDVTISKVVELEMAGQTTWILPDATRENLLAIPWCRPHFVDADGEGIMSVHALLIESQGQ